MLGMPALQGARSRPLTVVLQARFCGRESIKAIFGQASAANRVFGSGEILFEALAFEARFEFVLIEGRWWSARDIHRIGGQLLDNPRLTSRICGRSLPSRWIDRLVNSIAAIGRTWRDLEWMAKLSSHFRGA
jgi:hypothetical protein